MNTDATRYLGVDAAGYAYCVRCIYDDGYNKVVTISQLAGIHYAETFSRWEPTAPDAYIFKKIVDMFHLN